MPNFILFLPLLYILRTIIFAIGAAIERNKIVKKFYREELPFVSVVVSSRNEEKYIKNCIISIYQSNYPKELFEIIAVEDRSSDNTLKILQKLQSKIPNLKVLSIKEENPNINLKGKAGAIQAGIEESKGEYALLTDGDCKVSKNWINTLVNHYSDEKIALLASFTIVRGTSIFEIFQGLEWLLLETMASAGFGLKYPLGCFGNNMSVRKSDFMEIGGYRNVKFSVTEDLALLTKFAQLGKEIRHVVDSGGLVQTVPSWSLYQFLRQRRRWLIGGKSLGLKTLFFVIASIAILSGILYGIFTQNYEISALFILTKVICDTLLILPTLTRLRQLKYLPFLPFGIIFNIFIEFIIPFLLISNTVVWKKQKFS